MFAISVASYAFIAPYHQDDPRRRRTQQRASSAATDDDKDKQKTDTSRITAQPILDDDEDIPDSLLNPRWKIQRTQPITYDDLDQGSADLDRPENMKQTVVYNDTIARDGMRSTDKEVIRLMMEND